MYKAGDYLVFKNDVCVVSEIKKNHIGGKDYYILKPVYDQSLTLEIPTDNKNGLLRDVISKQDAEELIKKIPSIEVISTNDKMIENIYKELLKNSNMEDFVKIIKTTYLRNKERLDNRKKVGEIDNAYFNKAEKLLYTELSISLGKSYDETKEYIFEKMQNS